MSISRKRTLAFILAIAVFIQLFGVVNIARVKTSNSKVNIGISSMNVSLAPPVNKPVYFGEKAVEDNAVVYAVLNCFIGDLRQKIIANFDKYEEFNPVISRKLFEVFRE